MNLAGAKIVGYFSIPHPSLAGENPDAYMNAFRNVPSGAGSCAHCGMGILHHVVVMTSDGQKHFIGGECAKKAGDSQMRKAVKSKITSEQAENIEAFHKAKADEYSKIATIDALKKKEKIKKWFWLVEELVGSKKSWQVAQSSDGWFFATTPLGYRFSYKADSFERISAQGSNFIEGITASLISGLPISERASHIICEILAKRHGRMGSKNYNSAFNDYCEKLKGISDAN